jgi:hypothetical protein
LFSICWFEFKLICRFLNLATCEINFYVQ